MLEIMNRKITWGSVFFGWLAMLVGLNSPVYARVDIGSYFGRGTVVGGTIGRYSQITQLFNPFIATAYAIAGLVVFFVVLGGGFMYIMGAGQSDAKRLEQGKQALTWGIIGLIVIFVSYWLIRIIELLTGMDIFGGGGL
jgi:FtsH-binding integral membrane protein